MLENLVGKYKKPCMLDLKMGRRQYGNTSSSEKRKLLEERCANSTSTTLGFRVCGMQVCGLLICSTNLAQGVCCYILEASVGNSVGLHQTATYGTVYYCSKMFICSLKLACCLFTAKAEHIQLIATFFTHESIKSCKWTCINHIKL